MSAVATKGYTVEQCVEVIKNLAQSQGFYSRLYANIIDTKENSPEAWEDFKEVMESQNFKDPVDIILFFEEAY